MPSKSLIKSWKRRILDTVFDFIGPPLIAGVVRLLALTVRVEWAGREHYEAARRSGRPVIYAFWHEDLVGMALGFLKTRHPAAAVMISRSRDGEKLSRVISRLGLVPVRASSSRGAVQGFIEMLRWLTGEKGQARLPEPSRASPLFPDEGDDARFAAIALDGPRGPRHQAKPGAAMLARKAGALVVPVAFEHSREKVFRSWDRTRLPLPWSRMCIHVGEPMDAAGWSDDDMAQVKLLEERVNDCHREHGED